MNHRIAVLCIFPGGMGSSKATWVYNTHIGNSPDDRRTGPVKSVASAFLFQ